VDRICQDEKYGNGPYCEDFGIYKEICMDMPGMKSCNDYTLMCTEDSVVKECFSKTLPLPSFKQTMFFINSICSNMDMSGCEQCNTGSCEVLSVYSTLCLQMPDMEQCMDWKSICAIVPNWPICVGNEYSSPVMKMYFHFNFNDYVLFKEWIPKTTMQYTGTWLAVFIFTALFDGFRFLRHLLEKKWAKDNEEKLSKSLNNPSCHEELEPLTQNSVNKSPPTPPFRWDIDIPRSLLQFVETGWSFLIMLIAMTFNFGLFIAICSGAAFGCLLFGRYLLSTGKSHH